jgi:FtsH-binding integral membrane protein
MNANSSSYQQTGAAVKVNAFIRSTYNWMAIGLGITAAVAYFVANSPAALELIYGNTLVRFAVMLAPLGFVFFLGARIQKIQASTATTLFILFATLMGMSLSSIFIVYTASSIASTFVVCSATFLACSIYGMVTKRDLTSMGGFMMMGLIGIIIASIVNIFVQSSGLAMIISYVGVLVFVGLTAYDTQKLKTMAATLPDNATGAMVRKGAIMGALNLYLDFINLFIMLLHIFGGSKD